LHEKKEDETPKKSKTKNDYLMMVKNSSLKEIAIATDDVMKNKVHQLLNPDDIKNSDTLSAHKAIKDNRIDKRNSLQPKQSISLKKDGRSRIRSSESMHSLLS